MSNNPYISIRALPDTERSVAGPFTGVAQNVGTPLSVNPVIIIFDNQSTVAVQVSIAGVSWKTFAAGEALVLDMKANAAHAASYTFDLGTQFSLIGTGGSGSFYISIIYAG